MSHLKHYTNEKLYQKEVLDDVDNNFPNVSYITDGTPRVEYNYPPNRILTKYFNSIAEPMISEDLKIIPSNIKKLYINDILFYQDNYNPNITTESFTITDDDCAEINGAYVILPDKMYYGTDIVSFEIKIDTDFQENDKINIITYNHANPMFELQKISKYCIINKNLCLLHLSMVQNDYNIENSNSFGVIIERNGEIIPTTITISGRKKLCQNTININQNNFKTQTRTSNILSWITFKIKNINDIPDVRLYLCLGDEVEISLVHKRELIINDTIYFISPLLGTYIPFNILSYALCYYNNQNEKVIIDTDVTYYNSCDTLYSPIEGEAKIQIELHDNTYTSPILHESKKINKSFFKYNKIIPSYRKFNEQTSISLPNTINTIFDNAFAGNEKLVSINIPESVNYIGSDSFTSTGIYMDENNWVNGLLYIDNCLIDIKNDFDGETLEIKEGTRLMSNCSNPNNIKKIIIPSTLQYINSIIDAEYIVSPDNKYYSSENGILFNKDKSVLLRYPSIKTDTNYVIPNTVKHIGPGAFLYCTKLESITIPNSVTYIDDFAFASCSSLTNITIPNSVTNIGFRVFSECSNLTSVTISDNVTCISDGMFSSCSSLTNITIPNSVTVIGLTAFSDCISLTSIDLPDSVVSIMGDAFRNCSNLESIKMSNNIEYISYESFRDTKLMDNEENWENGIFYINDFFISNKEDVDFSNIRLRENSKICSVIPFMDESLSQINNNFIENNKNLFSFVDNMILSKDKKILLWCYGANNNSDKCLIPNTVKYISTYSITNINQNEIVFPDSVKYLDYLSIGRQLVNKKIHITIPENIEYISLGSLEPSSFNVNKITFLSKKEQLLKNLLFFTANYSSGYYNCVLIIPKDMNTSLVLQYLLGWTIKNID